MNEIFLKSFLIFLIFCFGVLGIVSFLYSAVIFFLFSRRFFDSAVSFVYFGVGSLYYAVVFYLPPWVLFILSWVFFILLWLCVCCHDFNYNVVVLFILQCFCLCCHDFKYIAVVLFLLPWQLWATLHTDLVIDVTSIGNWEKCAFPFINAS